MFSAPGFISKLFSAAASILLSLLRAQHTPACALLQPQPSTLSFFSSHLCFLAIFFKIVPRRWAPCERFGLRRSLCLGSRQQSTYLPHSLPRPTGHLNLVRRWVSSPSLDSSATASARTIWFELSLNSRSFR
ncbi:hypothetical protein BDW68DRAFT_164414 [Aspergillus falconensis]